MGKLHEQMKADLTLKGYSEYTHEAYLRYLRGFAKHFMRSPAEMGEEETRKTGPWPGQCSTLPAVRQNVLPCFRVLGGTMENR